MLNIYDPIAQIQHHYQRELQGTLDRLGRPVDEVVTVAAERSAGDSGRLRPLGQHVRAARRLVATPRATTIVAWPLLGWLELPLWASGRSQAALIFHDPAGLRRQIGLGPRYTRPARLAAGPGTRPPRIITQSDAATRAVTEAGFGRLVHQLLHPTLAPAPVESFATADGTVSVLGQFKPARDLELLTRLGGALRARGLAPKIFGRGWPELPGWEIDNRFLSEEELDKAVDSSAAVLVPYRDYFQSGIAIRAIERSTPVVGLRTSFLADLIGAASPGIVAPGGAVADWLASIDAVLAMPAAEVAAVHADYACRADASWGRLLAELDASS